MSTAAATEPGEALAAFFAALERRDLPALQRGLCREACFLTADRTPIRGRERIGALLGQLIAAGLRARLRESAALELSDFALLTARLQVAVPGGPQPFEQTSEGHFALTHREGAWKLLLVAPWGWP